MGNLIGSDQSNFDFKELVAALNRLLRLRTTPIGMKLFATVDEMEAITRIRRPKAIHTTDQIVGMAARNGWTVGITMEDLVGAQCGIVIGLHPRSDEWLSGERMQGVWYAEAEDASSHQQAPRPSLRNNTLIAVASAAISSSSTCGVDLGRSLRFFQYETLTLSA